MIMTTGMWAWSPYQAIFLGLIPFPKSALEALFLLQQASKRKGELSLPLPAA
jgi:hypothetical protein